MNNVIIGLVSSAIGFAISPISLIELILVVFSRRARVNGIVFLLTLAVPLFLLPLLGATAVKAATGGAAESGSGGSAWFQVGFGAVLLLMALANLRKYNDTDAPKVFDTIEGMGPGAVFVLAIGVTLFNPKNLALLLAAGETMREASMEMSQILLVSALFTLVAMSPFLAVVGYQLFGGDKAAERLTAIKAVLLRNNHKIMFWVCGLIGAVMLARGVPALLG